MDLKETKFVFIEREMVRTSSIHCPANFLVFKWVGQAEQCTTLPIWPQLLQVEWGLEKVVDSHIINRIEQNKGRFHALVGVPNHFHLFSSQVMHLLMDQICVSWDQVFSR